MQLSDREIQNTIDLLKKRKAMSDAGSDRGRARDEERIKEVVKRIEGMPEPEFRKERVEKLKEALEASSYSVSGDDIAKKLIGRIFSDKIR